MLKTKMSKMTTNNADGTRVEIEPDILLTVSIVTFNPDLKELNDTLKSLSNALSKLHPAKVVITFVDNSSSEEISSLLNSVLKEADYNLIYGQGNIGFGRAHNLALRRVGRYHLILNPDIEMASDALRAAVEFMEENPSCGLVSPHAVWPNGERQYLCKRYPAILDLVLRGFAPHWIRNILKSRQMRYEMQSETQHQVYWNPPIVSGCFMFFRSEILNRIEGFDHRYFLYFEDFDLAIRCKMIAKTAYVPSIRIIHSGGRASSKGLWHIKQFIKSAARFYATHGLKIL